MLGRTTGSAGTISLEAHRAAACSGVLQDQTLNNDFLALVWIIERVWDPSRRKESSKTPPLHYESCSHVRLHSTEPSFVLGSSEEQC